MNKTKRIHDLIEILNRASKAYYAEDTEIMSNYEYDKLYDELVALEEETGIVLANSPTVNVGYETVTKLKKVIHSHPMLSLDKTKSVDDLRKFAGDKDCILSLKMDGLTILLTYENGELVQAETRGNGETGEVITHNAKVFENIPLHINYKGHLEIEGEAIITYSDFEAINAKLAEDDKYKNPRNLASGSVRQLNSNIAAERHLKFIAWKVPVIEDEITNDNSFLFRLNFVKKLGFETVLLFTYTKNSSDDENLEQIIKALKNKAKLKGYPIDGLVMTYNDIKYGESLGMTGHHPRHSIAFKFYDEEVTTTLRDIEWSCGKTGQLTPVAIFDSVEIDGTEVSRASVHNWSMVQDLQLGIGDTITVYKANMIIPQIADNLTRSGTATFPDTCPICSSLTKIIKDKDTKVIVCDNDSCQGKLLGRLSHFVSKNAMDIDGLSEATLEYMIKELYVTSFKDLYTIPFMKEVYDKWIVTPGFGKRSVDKLKAAIEQSRNTTLDRVLYAQSIPLIGRTASKDISKLCNGSIDAFCDIITTPSRRKDFLSIEGFGNTMYASLMEWYDNHWIEFLGLIKEFNIVTETTTQNKSDVDLQGKSFCITGKLVHYTNRDELVNVIEQYDGKYVSGVTSKTDYLINNDTESTSGKNKKAKDLGIPVISEEEFRKMIGG